MPDSTNPQLINWCNNRLRTIADLTARLIAASEAYQSDYVAGGIGTLASTAGASNIADGYATDGRLPVTGTQIANHKAAIDKLVTNFSSDLVSGVGTTVKTIVSPIQVNGTPR